MLNWEYDKLIPPQYATNIIDLLNEKGAEGWEHYDTVGGVFLLKRPLREEVKEANSLDGTQARAASSGRPYEEVRKEILNTLTEGENKGNIKHPPPFGKERVLPPPPGKRKRK